MPGSFRARLCQQYKKTDLPCNSNHYSFKRCLQNIMLAQDEEFVFVRLPGAYIKSVSARRLAAVAER